MSRLADMLREALPPLDPDPPLEHGTPAAVVVPIVDGKRPSVIFTKRTDTVRDHKGEISFPGGVRHGEDTDLFTTALRETEEELGIPATSFDVVGSLPATPTFVSGYVIAPFVGILSERPVLIPSAAEIAQVIELDLAHLLEVEREVPVARGIHATMFVCEIDEHLVWGATGRILHDLLEVLRNGGWR